MAEPFDLRGRVAVITGGNAGIGAGIARALAQAGASVAIWGRREPANAAAADALRGAGATALPVTCDVADADAVERAMADTIAALGKVDVCVAAAGVAASAHPFATYPDDEWARVLQVDLHGAFHTLRAAAREMSTNAGGGSIVVLGSVASRFGQARYAPYAAAKSAIPGMVRTLAVELARHRVRVNAVLPGWVDTEMTAELRASERVQAAVASRVPLRRWGHPDDFAGIALYLASDASAYHTGDVICIDGGYSIY